MTPIDLSREDLENHLQLTLEVLASSVTPGSDIKLSVDEAIDPLVAGLVGSGCETAERTRGNTAPVAPMLDLGSGLWAWLGYREEWNVIKKGGQPRYRFRGLGTTIHFGFKGLDPKPQMFRAEWAGPLSAPKETFVFAAGNAGHPHWQFDAIDSLLAPADSDRAREFVAILKAEHEEAGIQDFTPDAVENNEVRDVICGRSLAPIHFASVAPWWRSAAARAHAHVPATTKQLRDWLDGTLSYVSEELGRL